MKGFWEKEAHEKTSPVEGFDTLNFLSLDFRSVAIFRVGLALLLMGDLVDRSRFLSAHYTDLGVLPRGPLLESYLNSAKFSLHLIHGSEIYQGLLFLVAFVFAMALLVGYRTRWATFFSWVLLISLHTRNEMVLVSGDVVLRMLLFWGMFLPLGAKYSVDEVRAPSDQVLPAHIVSMGSVALILQVCFIYWSGALEKSDTIWWRDGTAIYYALSLEQISTRLGEYILQFPDLLKVLTLGVWWFEFLGPLLLFTPYFRGPVRTAVVFGFILLHLGFGACIELGIFTYIMFVAWVVLLPEWFWEKLKTCFGATSQGTEIIWFCEGDVVAKRMTRIVEKMILPGNVVVRCPSEGAGLSVLWAQGNRWCYVTPTGEKRTGWKALSSLLKRSPIFFLVGKLFQWKSFFRLGEVAYGWVASSRFPGLIARYLSPTPGPKLAMGAGQTVVVFFLLCIALSWNFLNTKVSDLPAGHPGKVLTKVGYFLGIDQHWNMFSSSTIKDDGWHVIPAELRSGKKVDLYRDGQPVIWEKPQDIWSEYPNQRWSEYLLRIVFPANKAHRLHYGRFLCRQWNDAHEEDEKVLTFKIFFMEERTEPDYKPSKIKKKKLWSHQCYKDVEAERKKAKKTKSK